MKKAILITIACAALCFNALAQHSGSATYTHPVKKSTTHTGKKIKGKHVVKTDTRKPDPNAPDLSEYDANAPMTNKKIIKMGH